jgi:hypothetical protein
MHARALRGLLAALAVATSWPSLAQVSAVATARAPATASCQVPDADGSPLADRAGLLARYEQLPRPCLQQIFRACNDASKEAMLDFGSAATCSLGYEALLSRHFDGDFGRLLAWWNSERATQVE